MRILLLLPCLLAASAQTIDDALLVDIFGTPPPPTSFPPPVTQKLEDITVGTTQANTVLTDKEGDVCQCVPYYLCDANNQLKPENETAAETGWGVIDIRFGESKCQESIEVCCTKPKTEEEVAPSTPPPKPKRGCGYSNPKGLDFTITGGNGNEAQFGEFPWVVALLDSETTQYIGVGVLIHPEVVMTAAHNIAERVPSSLVIRAGEWDTQTEKERLRHETRSVQDMFIHEDYRPKSLWNDMSLLRLSEPVELADHIGTLCLPQQDEDFSKKKECVANGWGKDTFGQPGRYAVILKKIVLNMMPNDVCEALFKNTRLGPRFRLHGSFVCAGGEEGKDTCQGDGGAPLACPTGGDRYRLTGLVAWGIGCGQRHVPAAYVNVAKFRRWTDTKMAAWGLAVEEE